jgi:hypothetical protein
MLHREGLLDRLDTFVRWIHKLWLVSSFLARAPNCVQADDRWGQ